MMYCCIEEEGTLPGEGNFEIHHIVKELILRDILIREAMQLYVGFIAVVTKGVVVT